MDIESFRTVKFQQKEDVITKYFLYQFQGKSNVL